MRRALTSGFLLALISGAGASAQSLSVEEIRAKVDQSLRDLGSYQELLADPDPARSSAAMKVMLESGDAELQRIALDYGLYSPNPVVRRKALEGFFASEPRIEVFIEGGSINGTSSWDRLNAAVRAYGGSLNASNTAYFTWKIGKYDAGGECFLDSEGKSCVVRITDSGVSIRPWDAWLLLTPNEEGSLIGAVAISNAGRFPLRIPIRQ